MNKICTSQEQSQKLIELGIDRNTADMYYDVNSYGIQSKPEVAVGKVWSKDIPAWSLTVLLDILPLEIELHKQSDGNIKYYYMEYTTKKTYFASKRYTNPIDAAFEIICWLLEYKKL